MKTHTAHRGFTLIELLVVVAIIGILAAIILASLGTARGRANDSKAQSELSSMRVQAEIFYSGHGSSYDPNGNGTDLFTADATEGGLVDLIDDLEDVTTGGEGAVYAQSWAWHAILGQSGADWCVDSNGYSGDEKAFDDSGTVATCQ